MGERRAAGSWLLTAALLIGCSDSDEASGSEPGAVRVSFATFNTALGVGLAQYPAERLQRIADELPRLGADVVCLQEVWQLGQAETLTAALQEHFDYAHYSVAAATSSAEPGAPACDPAEAELLAGCFSEHCADLEPSEVALCAVANCADEFATVSSTCQDCIAANQENDPDTIITICGSEGAQAAQVEHQNGLLLLSRFPLLDADHLVLDSSLGDRGVLSARMETDLLPDVQLHCTHLAATLTELPYTGTYGSWAGERTAQIEQLLQHVAAKRPNGGAVVLLGDLNCGPETEQLAGADPDNFARLEAGGFEAPFVDGGAADCTWCTENPMTGGTEAGGQDVIIDHVLLSDVPLELTRRARRVLDDPVQIEVDGQRVETSLSDHFGVRVAVVEPDPLSP